VNRVDPCGNNISAIKIQIECAMRLTDGRYSNFERCQMDGRFRRSNRTFVDDISRV
jgi:hypothetical protein